MPKTLEDHRLIAEKLQNEADFHRQEADDYAARAEEIYEHLRRETGCDCFGLNQACPGHDQEE